MNCVCSSSSSLIGSPTGSTSSRSGNGDSTDGGGVGVGDGDESCSLLMERWFVRLERLAAISRLVAMICSSMSLSISSLVLFHAHSAGDTVGPAGGVFSNRSRSKTLRLDLLSLLKDKSFPRSATLLIRASSTSEVTAVDGPAVVGPEELVLVLRVSRTRFTWCCLLDLALM